MKVGEIIALSDFESLKANHAEPARHQITSIGTLVGPHAAFRFHFVNEECSQGLLSLSITRGKPIRIFLTREDLVQPRNRRQMVEAGEGWMFTNPAAAPGADLSTSLQYVPDLNDPSGHKFNNVLEAHGEYAENPVRPGLAGVKLYGHLVVYENASSSEDITDTHRVIFEFGSPQEKDGGLITLFKGRLIQEQEIES